MAETKVTSGEAAFAPTVGTNSGTAGGSLSYVNIGSVKYCWGQTASLSANAGAVNSGTVVFPASFFTQVPTVTCSAGSWTGTAKILGGLQADPSTTGCTPQVQNFDTSNGSAKISWIAIGV